MGMIRFLSILSGGICGYSDLVQNDINSAFGFKKET